MLNAVFNGLKFVIEEDNPDVGAYLYVYRDGNCIYDYLQNDVNMCVRFAFEDFGVPEDIWVEG
jgi:hypothetical protein